MIAIDPVRYPKIVVALGGNALIRPREAGTLEEQRRRISQAMAPTADLVTSGFASISTLVAATILASRGILRVPPTRSKALFSRTRNSLT